MKYIDNVGQIIFCFNCKQPQFLRTFMPEIEILDKMAVMSQPKNVYWSKNFAFHFENKNWLYQKTSFYLFRKQHTDLSFTREKISGILLQFIDVEVTIRDRKINIRVHHKRTFTNVLLHFNIIAPLSWKRGLITCLSHSAYSYSSKVSSLEIEINFIIFLYRNGYPTSIHFHL